MRRIVNVTRQGAARTVRVLGERTYSLEQCQVPVARMARVVPAAVQHDAVRVLRLHGRLQLRQSQRQVVLAVDDRSAADDASRRTRDRRLHQSLRRLRRPGQCRRFSQSDHRRSRLSARLDRTLDWIQLCHGTIDCFVVVIVLPTALDVKTIDSVRLSVCLSVCPFVSTLYILNRLFFELEFLCMCG